MTIDSLYISALRKSSGKTTVAVGLAAAAAGRGRTVRTFKKGPDFIDPMWLGQAAGAPCWNLDFYTMSDEEILAAFAAHAAAADLAVIEGNKGLYDGVDVDGADSNDALAALLGTPVVLVVDTRGMTRGIAPVIQGYQSFGTGIRIVGLILNQVGGPRHEGKLRAAVERYTDIPVLGSIGRHPEMEIAERHIGLVPTNETPECQSIIASITRVVEEDVDVERLIACAAPARAISSAVTPLPKQGQGQKAGVRLGIARDPAFAFYYPDDLEALSRAGAELVPFDTLSDPGLPDVDALFIGGGFPETQAAGLAANGSLRRDVRAALEAGMPAYVECGGLMYLARSLTWKGESHEMVGAVPADVVMHDRPVGRGYVKLRETGKGPWPPARGGQEQLPAHEFHYASLENLSPGQTFAYRVERGYGIDGHHDGVVIGNLVATFSHQRDVAANRWAERFVDFIRACGVRRGSGAAEPTLASS